MFEQEEFWSLGLVDKMCRWKEIDAYYWASQSLGLEIIVLGHRKMRKKKVQFTQGPPQKHMKNRKEKKRKNTQRYKQGS